MSVSMSGALPAGDGNGLSAIMSDLVRDPQKMHVTIALVDCRKVVTDADSGDSVPTVRIRRIEVITSEDDLRVAERLMRRALEQRTGQETLPYDLEEEMSSVFADLQLTEDGTLPEPPEPPE